MNATEHQSPTARRPSEGSGRSALAAGAAGAAAVGALAIGAAAIGAVAIGRLAIRKASVERLQIGELVVDRLNRDSQGGRDGHLRGPVEVEGPFRCGDDSFALRFSMRSPQSPQRWRRQQVPLRWLELYTLRGGQIVHSEIYRCVDP